MTRDVERPSASRADSLLASDIVGHLIGVIDLKAGHAVHAIAGQREAYQGVDLGEGCRAGHALDLSNHYRKLGLRRLYIADLDAIGGERPQILAIRELIDSNGDLDEILIDIGWTGDNASDLQMYGDALQGPHRQLAFIAATESAGGLDAVNRLAELVSPERVFLSLDYRGGRLINTVADESKWISRGSQCNIAGMIVLDLTAVGTNRGAATAAICERVRNHTADLKLYSGGGIHAVRHVHQLQQSGCDACLVATALHGIGA